MADWKKLAISALLADGKIDNAEVKLLKKELWADKKIDSEEVKFLIELRNSAQKKAKGGRVNPAFTKLFFSAIESNVLKDGQIDAGEARWLRQMLFADGKIDADEMKFIRTLAKKARKKSPAFETLVKDCQAKAKKK